MSDKHALKLGIIGYGYWGPNLTRNFIELPTTDVVAIADLSEKRREMVHAKYPGVQTVGDYHELFSLGLDAVIVATPPRTHYEVTRDCLEHGLNVMVEKPLALTVQDAEALTEIAQNRHLKLMVGHTFEYNLTVRALKDIITSGDLGDILYIDTVRVNLGLYQRGLNVMWDLAPHDISILLYLLEEVPTAVSARGGACLFPDTYDLTYLHLNFPSGVLAHIHTSWLHPNKVRRITVVGTKKMAVYDDVELIERIKIYDKGVDVPSEEASTFGDFQFSYRYGDVVSPHVDFIEPLRMECQHFADCVIHDWEPQSNGVVGTNVVRVVESAERSLLNDGQTERITLPNGNRLHVNGKGKPVGEGR